MACLLFITAEAFPVCMLFCLAGYLPYVPPWFWVSLISFSFGNFEFYFTCFSLFNRGALSGLSFSFAGRGALSGVPFWFRHCHFFCRLFLIHFRRVLEHGLKVV